MSSLKQSISIIDSYDKISYIIMEIITICMQESISLDKPPNRQKNIDPAKTWNPWINKK